MWLCQLWLFRYSVRFVSDPCWRPEGNKLDGNPSPTPYTGTGRHQHSRAVTELIRPNFEWHEWSIATDQDFCGHTRSAVCGGGGSSKSFTAGDYALKFWLCAPDVTAVVVASTSIDAARKRIWKSIGTGYTEICRRVGKLGTSQMLSSPKPMIRNSSGDAVHGIYVVPVEQGDIDKAVDAIKGYHARRVLMVRDESDAVSEAVISVESNLRIGTEEFQSIDLGNLPSSLNPLGKQMAPAPGKPVTESLGPEWMSSKGIKCRRLDGEQSPNIKDKGKWTGLMTEEDRADIERQAGGKNTRTYYVMVKGLPPPDGVDDTVISEPLLHAHSCFDKVTWKGSFIMSGALDPGFGGDMCCYRTFKRGDDTTGAFRAQCEEIIPIPIIVGDPKNPAEYQIAAKVIELSKARGIIPDEFIAGTTGIGSGVGATLKREWSPDIHTCEEGGSPSDKIVSEEDPRPANELYDRRVTELWFSIREFAQAAILRGLDEKTATQLCQRKWEFKAKKKSVQKKEEMPSSPNEADTLGFYIELLRSKGIQASIQSKAKSESNSSLEQELAEQDFDSSEFAYADDFPA